MNFTQDKKPCAICALNVSKLLDLSCVLNGTMNFPNNGNDKIEKLFQNFYFWKPETAAMFFPVLGQTASRIPPLIHFNASGGSFGIHTCKMPSGEHRAFPSFLSLPLRR